MSNAPSGNGFGRIAVLTSGGDAPGMNAAIRAVVRSGISCGMQVLGIRDGYTGLMEGHFLPLGPRNVGGIIERGGTILGSSRCARMKQDAGQLAAIDHLRHAGVGALIVIGGNGSQAGAAALSRRGLPVIGIASTIDNDIPRVDVTIGTTTAVETALEAIDRLRITASSHHRGFLVEVMGRDCGYLALMAGIAGGAEAIVVPEAETTPEEVAMALRNSWLRGKSHAIVVVSEGSANNAERMSTYFNQHSQRLGFELRVTRLGHIQRGGSPCAFDRLIATQLGAAAVEQAAAGRHGILLGIAGSEVKAQDLQRLDRARKPLNTDLLALASILAD